MAPLLRALEPQVQGHQSARGTDGMQVNQHFAEYQDRFEALLPRTGTLSEAQRVQALKAGLQPPLSLDVELHNPQSLIVAMSLARKLELRKQYAAVVVPPPAPPSDQQ